MEQPRSGTGEFRPNRRPRSGERPWITLVVQNYNYARYLPEALDSIASQSHAPDRVIIIDDASTDESVAIISAFLDRHPTWELVRHETNKGCVPTQNALITGIETEWIGWLGADDVLHPAYLSQVLPRTRDDAGAGLICACTEIIDGTDQRKLRPIMLPADRPGYLGPHRARQLLELGDNYFCGTVTLFRLSALQALGGFDSRLESLADSLMARQIALKHGFIFLPEILGYWRIHTGNYSAKASADPDVLNGLIAQVRRRVQQDDLFPAGYADLLERRVRFGAARQALLSAEPGAVRAGRVAGILGDRRSERVLRSLLSRLGPVGLFAALSWLTLRTRPMSLARLLRQALRRRAIIAARAARRPAR
jgi:hypothetical protein